MASGVDARPARVLLPLSYSNTTTGLAFPLTRRTEVSYTLLTVRPKVTRNNSSAQCHHRLDSDVMAGRNDIVLQDSTWDRHKDGKVSMVPRDIYCGSREMEKELGQLKSAEQRGRFLRMEQKMTSALRPTTSLTVTSRLNEFCTTLQKSRKTHPHYSCLCKHIFFNRIFIPFTSGTSVTDSKK